MSIWDELGTIDWLNVVAEECRGGEVILAINCQYPGLTQLMVNLFFSLWLAEFLQNYLYYKIGIEPLNRN